MLKIVIIIIIFIVTTSFLYNLGTFSDSDDQ